MTARSKKALPHPMALDHRRALRQIPRWAREQPARCVKIRVPVLERHNKAVGAEGEGFEPPDRGTRSTAFKAAAFDRSATPPEG